MKNYTLKLPDLSLLLVRTSFSMLMFVNHGWPKVLNFEKVFSSFPDPLGVSAEVSYSLAVFAEVFCPVLIVFGLFTRFASIPLVITMGVAVFVVHGDDSFAKQELGLLYLVAFSMLLLSGPGKYSLDSRFKI
jgi:putative oxidoreductase